jgi:ribosomal protein S18 acetylase RimI-like enzyme
MITVQRTTSASGIELSDINELLLQLRADPKESLGTEHDLHTITSDANTLFITVTDGSKVIGMATAYLATKFGKKTGFVEDVVVSDSYRGQGLGRKVMEMLIDEAKQAGATQLYLTTRPEREAANALYQKLGFEKRETNVYRLKL